MGGGSNKRAKTERCGEISGSCTAGQHQGGASPLGACTLCGNTICYHCRAYACVCKECLDADKVEGTKEAAAYLEFVADQDFDRSKIPEWVGKGDALMDKVGHWTSACKALRHAWAMRSGDHLGGVVGPDFEGLVDEHLLEYARSVALHWVPLRRKGDPVVRAIGKPHPSAREFMMEIFETLWADSQAGRVLMTSRQGDPLEGLESVPVARVTKLNPDRTVSSKGRLVWNQKRPNKSCDKEDHPPALQPTHATFARSILFWAHRFPCIALLLAKKDIAAAFKIVWLAAQASCIFGADLPGWEFGVDALITSIYVSMTFGWNGGPGEWMPFAW